MENFNLATVAAVDLTIKNLLLAQLKAAQKAGFITYGLCSRGNCFDFLQSQQIIMHPIEIRRKISPFADLKTLFSLYRFFKKNKISIVHTHTPKCSLLGQLAAKLAGVPVIVNTIHGFYFHDNMKPFARNFYIAMEKIAALCSSKILSQNPEDIDTAIKLKICKPEKIELLGNGINLDVFNPERFDSNFRKQKRAELGIPENDLVIGIIGRLVREKGYLELIEAFRQICQIRKNVWLVIIGPEEPEKSDKILPHIFRQNENGQRTLYLGMRDDIPELLVCFDVYVLPSWREGFPRSAIEAAAMRLPIVATDIRGCRQVVENGKNGFLVPVKSPDALVNALLNLLDDEGLRIKAGIAGFEKARKEFNEDRVCEIVIKTYKLALKESQL